MEEEVRQHQVPDGRRGWLDRASRVRKGADDGCRRKPVQS
jgi:hypothetical protein